MSQNSSVSNVSPAVAASQILAFPTSPTSLIGAICAVSSKIRGVGKAGFNSFHKYTFVKAPDLARVLTPLMSEAGIAILQSEVSHEMIADGVLRVEFEFTILHAGSGESRIVRASGMSKVAGGSGGFNDRAIQAIATTTRKYFLIQLFGVVVDDGIDVDAQDGEAKKRDRFANVSGMAKQKVAHGQPDQVANSRLVAQNEQSHSDRSTEFSGDVANNEQDTTASAEKAEVSDRHVVLNSEDNYHAADSISSRAIAARDAVLDRETEARRAAVQLARMLPQRSPPPVKSRLDKKLDKERGTGTNWEAQIRTGQLREYLPSGENKARRTRKAALLQSVQTIQNSDGFSEINPPLHDAIPPFLDRRPAR